MSSPETTMHPTGTTGTVRVEDVFDTDAEDLWEAITSPERLARWIAEVDGDLRLGGAFKVRFTSTWEGTGTVTRCEPPRSLELAMDDGEGGSTTIVAELTPTDSGTHLRVEDRGLPLPQLHFHGAGWQVHIEDLRSEIAGEPTEEWKPRWEARMPDFPPVAGDD